MMVSVKESVQHYNLGVGNKTYRRITKVVRESNKIVVRDFITTFIVYEKTNVSSSMGNYWTETKLDLNGKPYEAFDLYFGQVIEQIKEHLSRGCRIYV